MKTVPIKLNTANALRYLGSLYRSPADAIKEHVSNAVDEYLKMCDAAAGSVVPPCHIAFHMERKRVVIQYDYGMTRDEFIGALGRVADSAKKHLDVGTIGQLGIGMFSFLQIGRKCVFYSKKGKGHERIKVTLREGSDSAEFDTPRKREGLTDNGIQIVIGDLLFDATKPRGPLAPARLQRVFNERFDKFIRDERLAIDIHFGGKVHRVAPRRIDLPRIGEAYENWRIPESDSKVFTMELYYDPAGKGQVAIRHMGVVIVKDVASIDAYGLEESVFAGGYLRGAIDADFLRPLPARSGFEENSDWIALLSELDRLRPAIETEVETHRQESAIERLAEVQRKAIELARNILDTEEFGDLELLDGLGRRAKTPRLPPSGFDFTPASARVEEGKRGRLVLKAMVPGLVPDESVVTFSTSNTAIELQKDRAVLRVADANKLGVVAVALPFLAKASNTTPIVITARCGNHEATARVRVGRFKLARQDMISGNNGAGRGINYTELPFEDGAERHSRYRSRIVEINDLNKDYRREVLLGGEGDALTYAALLIGKETIAFNDKTGTADEYLEKMLSFLFRLRKRMEPGRSKRKLNTKPPAAR